MPKGKQQLTFHNGTRRNKTMTKTYSQTIELLASFQFSVSLEHCRFSLQRKGLLDLCASLNIKTTSKMNKKDLWEAIMGTSMGAELAGEILEIDIRKQNHGAEAQSQVVELSTKGSLEEDGESTGIYARSQAIVNPVLRNHQGLETLIYRKDPRNPISPVVVQFLENLHMQRDELYAPYSRSVAFRDEVRGVLRGKFMDAAAAAVARTLIQNDLEDFLRRYWTKNLNPAPSTEAFKSFTRLIGRDGEMTELTLADAFADSDLDYAGTQDIIKALAVGYDTFLSTRGKDRGWSIVRRNAAGDLVTILHLTPNFAMKSEQKVAESRNEASKQEKENVISRMSAMADVLKESFLGDSLPVVMSGLEEALEDLRNQARKEWKARVKPTWTALQKHDAFLQLWVRKREVLKRARAGAKSDFSDLWAQVHEWKCKYTYYRHMSNVAWENLDHEKIEQVKQAIADIGSPTRGVYWGERQWMSPTPQSEGPGRWDSDSYDVIAELYDAEKQDEVDAAFWDMIRSKSTPKSKAKNKAKIAMLNGCSPVGYENASFVDPAIAWELVKIQEEEEREANRPDDSVPMPELTEDEFQYFESASDEDLLATLEL